MYRFYGDIQLSSEELQLEYPEEQILIKIVCRRSLWHCPSFSTDSPREWERRSLSESDCGGFNRNICPLKVPFKRNLLRLLFFHYARTFAAVCVSFEPRLREASVG